MALDPVSAGQLVSSQNQNSLVRTINGLLRKYVKKGDVPIGTGILEQSRTLSIPDGTGLRAWVVNLATKTIDYLSYQPEIPQQTTPPSGPQIGDMWVDTS